MQSLTFSSLFFPSVVFNALCISIIYFSSPNLPLFIDNSVTMYYSKYIRLKLIFKVNIIMSQSSFGYTFNKTHRNFLRAPFILLEMSTEMKLKK